MLSYDNFVLEGLQFFRAYYSLYLNLGMHNKIMPITAIADSIAIVINNIEL